jgi:hypothetical protein
MSKPLAGAILSFHVLFDSDARLHAVGGTGGIFTDSYKREKTVHMVWEARVISGYDYHRERSHQREYLEDQHAHAYRSGYVHRLFSLYD